MENTMENTRPDVVAFFEKLPQQTRLIDLHRTYYEMLYEFLESPHAEIADLGAFVILRGREWTLKIYKTAEFGKPIAVLEPHRKPNPKAPLIRIYLVVERGCEARIYLDGYPNLKNVVLNNYDTFLTTEGTDTMPARPIFAYEVEGKMRRWFGLECKEEEREEKRQEWEEE